MSEKLYVTREEGEALAFGHDYKQVFHHTSSQAKTLPEYTLIKWFINQPKEFQAAALEVLDFLHRFTFASASQLARMLAVRGVEVDDLDALLAALLEQRMANFCYLSRFDQGIDPPEDAFRVYCLDFGALGILSHLTPSSDVSWFTTDVYRSPELMQKYLTTVLFYLSLAEVRGDSLRFFKPVFDVSIMHRDFRFSAAFDLMRGSVPHHFILESVRPSDLPVSWMNKVDKQLVPFSCQERYWTRYFADSEPVYIFLVQDKAQALETAAIFYRRTGKDNFRLITEDQLQGGLDDAVFLKYVPVQEEDPEKPGTMRVILEKTGSLKKVRSSLLSGSAAKK